MSLDMKNCKLLIQRIMPKVENDGVIYTEAHRHNSFRGKVIVAGAESYYKTGDIVVFSEFAGENVWVKDIEYIIIAEENVWAVEKA